MLQDIEARKKIRRKKIILANLLFVTGFVSFICAVVLAAQTIKSSGMLYLVSGSSMAVGIIVFVHYDVFDGRKNRLFSNVFVGMITFGPIVACLFLVTNKYFSAHNDMTVKSAIIEKYHEHTRAYIDKPSKVRYYASYSLLGDILSIGYDEDQQEIFDSSQFVITTYRKGFWGCDFIVNQDLSK